LASKIIPPQRSKILSHYFLLLKSPVNFENSPIVFIFIQIYFMRNIYILSILILFTLSACIKDEIRPDDPIISPCDSLISFIPYSDTCFSIPDHPTSMWINVSERQAFSQPNFHPNNDRWLLYLTNGPDQGGTSYWKADLCTGERNFITNETTPVYGRPRWGENDWIVFATQHKKLMKIKSNGDSLTALVPDIKCENPAWLPGNKIICPAELSQTPNISLSVIINIDGQIEDTLDANYSRPVYFNDKIAVSKGFFGEIEIGYLDTLNDYQFISVYPLPIDNFLITSMDWLDEKHIIWTDKIGLHKVNIETGLVTTIREECENRDIVVVASSPLHDGTIIFDEMHFVPEDPESSNTIHQDHLIYKYDLNTGEMWEIGLEE
jgi:hypothetical protein